VRAGNPRGLFQAPFNEQLRWPLYVALGLDHWLYALRYRGRHGVSRFQGHAPFFHPLQGRHPIIGEGAYCRSGSFCEQRSSGDGRFYALRSAQSVRHLQRDCRPCAELRVSPVLHSVDADPRYLSRHRRHDRRLPIVLEAAGYAARQ
jgi:hypothetical protein